MKLYEIILKLATVFVIADRYEIIREQYVFFINNVSTEKFDQDDVLSVSEV